MEFRIVVAAAVLFGQAVCAEGSSPVVRTSRVPNAGIQPQVKVGKDGAIHMVYYKGEAGAGDIFYVRSSDGGRSYTAPIRVNSQAESAIAAGTIRGAHLALGRNDRVHVAWNGSGKARPKGLPNPQLPKGSPHRHSAPMLYARLSRDGKGFEPQRNLMTSTYALDGGGSVAADTRGNVYVVWHGNSTTGSPGEGARAVWVATSRDDGATFSAESQANRSPTGACGCCGLRADTDGQGNLFVLYRTAKNVVHRDMTLLTSKDRGRSYSLAVLDKWTIGQCMMSSASFHSATTGTFGAWETEQQIRFGRVYPNTSPAQRMVKVTDSEKPTNKHPVLCANSKGQVILAWTEGTGWNKGGSVVWRVFDQSGKPVEGSAGRAKGVPVWGLVAVFAAPDDSFTVVF